MSLLNKICIITLVIIAFVPCSSSFAGQNSIESEILALEQSPRHALFSQILQKETISDDEIADLNQHCLEVSKRCRRSVIPEELYSVWMDPSSSIEEIVEKIETLNKGCWGTVYSVRFKNSEKMYAMKEVPFLPRVCWQQSKIKRDLTCAYEEFLTGVEQSHPSMMKTYHLKVEKLSFGRMKAYFIFELLSPRASPLETIDDALVFAFQFLDAVEYLYSKKVIPMDMHKGNVILLDSDELKLIDFGWYRTTELLSLKNLSRVANPFQRPVKDLLKAYPLSELLVSTGREGFSLFDQMKKQRFEEMQPRLERCVFFEEFCEELIELVRQIRKDFEYCLERKSSKRIASGQ